jgi:hypothetical protein
VIAGNTIVNNGPDSADASIAIHTPARVHAHLNSLLGLGTGLANLGSGTVGASANWWSCDAGPGAQGCSNVQGPGVDFAPWLTTPIRAQSNY